ncbi:hypothetical protein CKF54_00325 [Psittacicella hinzii]|uniref:Uncharacterized protein n=1 Tax=Psittacicella hinzii TaxID=2028575 RepID=A0A3A1Y9W9_9GAMM|nr:hypothetical protein [Psittacicella hinzii]RIY34475.1 hypothetical protein CKF54_00325 [Psittacicella hinzii]
MEKVIDFIEEIFSYSIEEMAIQLLKRNNRRVSTYIKYRQLLNFLITEKVKEKLYAGKEEDEELHRLLGIGLANYIADNYKEDYDDFVNSLEDYICKNFQQLRRALSLHCKFSLIEYGILLEDREYKPS